MSELSQTLAMPNAPHISFSPNSRYPDSAVEVLEPEFLKYRVYSSSVEQLASGCRWSEGPQWFGDHHCLLWSDIPGNRILRWDEASGSVSSFREPSNQANGLAREVENERDGRGDDYQTQNARVSEDRGHGGQEVMHGRGRHGEIAGSDRLRVRGNRHHHFRQSGWTEADRLRFATGFRSDRRRVGDDSQKRVAPDQRSHTN